MSPMSATPTDSRNGWKLCVSDARRAAERARTAASVAGAWAARAGAGAEQAAIAAEAAARALEAAERAARATSSDDIRREAAVAWSAMEAALDADRKTGVAIAAAMWADLDRRLAEDRQAA